MLRVIGIVLIVLASCVWIGFVGWDVFYGKNKTLVPALMFNKELDEAVLKVNYPEELNSFQLFESENVYLNLAPNKLEGLVLYFSKKRNCLLIESEVYWTDLAINDLIFNSQLKQSELRNISGKYVFFAQIDVQPNAQTIFDSKNADKNATANVFDLLESKQTDVYRTENGSLRYQTYTAQNVLGKPVDDKTLFADLLPSKIASYQFQSHFLAQQKDSVYANNVMSNWVNQGFVKAELEGEVFLVSDYKARQDPNLVLLQHLRNTDSIWQENGVTKYKNIRLTKDFPSNTSTGFFVLLLSDKVVLTQSVTLAQKIKLNYQLGNTLAVNKGQEDKIFGWLTTQVHERIFNENQKESTTYTNNIVYRVTSNLKEVTSNESLNATYSFLTKERIGFITPIKDHLRKGISTFVVAGKSYYLVDSKGKEIWSGQLDTIQTSDIKVVDIYQNNKKQLVFTNGNNLHVLDLNGKAVNGFPYANQCTFTSSVAHVFHTNQTRFLAGDKNGNIIYLDAKGGELNVLKVDDFPINTAPVLINQSSQLLAFVSSSTGYKKVFLEKSKIENLPLAIKKVLKLQNQIHFIQSIEEKVNILNSDLSVVNSLNSNVKMNTFGFSAHQSNQLSVYDSKGNLQFESPIQLSEISEVKQLKSKAKAYTLILDDVENNLYLFDDVGKLISGFPKEGKRLIEINEAATNQFNVYTTLDNNLICYSINL